MEHYLSPNDYLEIRLASVISDYDVTILVELYQPIIGHTALSLLLTLVSEEKKKQFELQPHSILFSRMQIATGDFLRARETLEAMGLLSTYIKQEGEEITYLYVVYGPKSPKKFFSDPLFKGLFIKYAGEKELNKESTRFYGNDNVEGYEEVSAKFGQVFNVDFNDSSFTKDVPLDSLEDQLSGKLTSDFDLSIFFKYIFDNGQIIKTALTKTQVNEIVRFAMLYSMSEDNMGDAVLDSYNPNKPKNERIDFVTLKKKCIEAVSYSFLSTTKNKISAPGEVPNSVSSKALLIRKMESLSPREFLQSLQDGIAPVSSDLFIIDSLSSKLQLTNTVINALVNYTLEKNNNILSKSFIEKVGATLVREKITTALDAINFLEGGYSSRKRNFVTQNKEVKEENKPIEEEKVEESSEDFGSLMAALKAKKGKK